MHNNFYFLRQLTSQLASVLTGAVVSECFSQSKDELVLRFETRQDPFLIRASLLPELSCLSFPDDFQRARKNSVDLFPEIAGRRVEGVRQYHNERSFSVVFTEGYVLLFKMHGNRTNLVLLKNEKVIALFRSKITADLKLDPEALDRNIDWSFETYLRHLHHPKALLFTFGKVVWHYLDLQNFAHLTPEEQWQRLQDVRRDLEEPSGYFITLLDNKPVLSLLNVGQVQQTLQDPLAAANAYYHTFIHDYAFSKARSALLHAWNTRRQSGESYIARNSERLAEIRREDHYRVWADLLMANLHAIPPGTGKVTLSNFYADNRPIEVRLKKDLTPQRNAEVYYRKAKNQHIEIERLESAIRQKKAELDEIEKKIQAIASSTDLKMLRAIAAEYDTHDPRQDQQSLPYHEFHFKGYRILVGKNAQANDTLTLKYSYKEDLWLHAKDVSGSHVLIKHQSGKNFPKDVIEYAASLAAYNSKRKNESLCPVIVTPKKFVRKRKGDPPGAVVVEREQVIMVQPMTG